MLPKLFNFYRLSSCLLISAIKISLQNFTGQNFFKNVSIVIYIYCSYVLSSMLFCEVLRKNFKFTGRRLPEDYFLTGVPMMTMRNVY